MKKKIKLIAVIPAHLASVRLKRKVLINLFGIPMLEHVRRRVVNSKIFDEVIVASGDEEIIKVVESNGGLTIKTFNNHKNGTSRVAEALKNFNYTHVVIIQGDEPLIKKEHLNRVTKLIEKDPSIDAWNSLTELNDSSDLESRNIVKASINDKGRIIYLFRKTPSFGEIKDQLKYIKKVQGLIAFRKEVLQEVALLPTSFPENIESIEQLRIISNGFFLQSVIQDDQVPSINEEKDLTEFFNYLEENKIQNALTQKIINE